MVLETLKRVIIRGTNGVLIIDPCTLPGWVTISIQPCGHEEECIYWPMSRQGIIRWINGFQLVNESNVFVSSNVHATILVYKIGEDFYLSVYDPEDLELVFTVSFAPGNFLAIANMLRAYKEKWIEKPNKPRFRFFKRILL